MTIIGWVVERCYIAAHKGRWVRVAVFEGGAREGHDLAVKRRGTFRTRREAHSQR